MKQLSRWWLLGVVLSSLACSALGTARPSPAVSPPPTTRDLPTAGAVAAPLATATLSPIIGTPELIVLAGNLAGPDDLLLAPDGSIYISDVVEGTVKRYASADGMRLIVAGLHEPEGMVFLPDGSLVIAEQGRNRLVRYQSATQRLEPFFQLSNTTSELGLDGLAWDAALRTIIVPDSPNGTVLRLAPGAQNATPVASGFARPTGAWVEPDGSILIADENGNSVTRIHPDGRLEKLAILPVPDDVIEDAQGNLFVTTLGDHAVHLISRVNGQDRVLAAEMIDPQGIIVDIDGNLVVTDPGNHRVIKLVIH